MAERLNAPVLKTGIPQGIGGSNPSRSAFFFRLCKPLEASYSGITTDC